VRGSLYGSGSPRHDIVKLIELYRLGKLKLDELLTRTYPVEQINEAYAPWNAARLRGAS
jgi:S-(hydroxymethyl)glutathione dehydrogenase/alcohol dehydrogenase